MKSNLFIKKIFCSVAFILTLSSLSLSSSAYKLDFNVETNTVEPTANFVQNIEAEKASLMSVELSESFTFENGYGTEESPYIISNAEELLYLSTFVNNWSESGRYQRAYYELANDIDLEGIEWEPIGTETYPFMGSFDGNGKTISNFKITESHIYTGFFGLMRNASITNITFSDVEIDFVFNDKALYIGVVAGRFESIYEETDIAIENCHVSNAKVSVKNNNRIYGSGHIGYLHCSQDANIVFSDCTTDAVCNFTIIDLSDSTITGTQDSLRSFMRIGGMLGYTTVTVGGNVEIYDCSSNATIISNFTNVALQELNDIHVGAFAGDIALSSANSENKSTLTLDRCYSTNMVYANADGGVYAGGFVGYLVSRASIISVSDCHTNSNVYAQSKAKESYYIAGFTGIAGLEDGGEININDCYSIGDVIAIRQKNSRGRRFVALVVGEPKFSGCYTSDKSLVVAEHKLAIYYIDNSETGIEKDLPEKVLSAEAAVEFTNYDGFDINIWEPGESPYNYPVLSDNKIVHGSYSAYHYVNNAPESYKNDIGYGEYPTLPDIVPDSHYIFSHWSAYPGSSDALDDSYTITSDVIVFPNDSTEPKSYNITFISLGDVYDVKSLKYDTIIEFPTNTPETYESVDKMFRYAFSHWSSKEDGAAVSDNFKIDGEKTFYAVFKKINLNVWDGVSTMSINQGNGTKDNPYLITNAYQLAHLTNDVNSGEAVAGAHYILAGDIDLGGYEWEPIGSSDNPFEGVFNGDGYNVYNFTITNINTQYAGLFGYVKNSYISNLDVSDFDIVIESNEPLSYYVGGVAGYIYSDKTDDSADIEQCRTAGNINIKSSSAYSGGIVGYSSHTPDSNVNIKNSYSECDISLDTKEIAIAGGISSNTDTNSNIEKVYYSGNISVKSVDTAIAGGIVGQASISSTSPISNVFFVGENIEVVSDTDGSYAGAIFGQIANENNDDFIAENVVFSNCSYLNSAVIIGQYVSASEYIVEISDIAEFYSSETLTDVYGFDCTDIWSASENDLPVLKSISRPKDKFFINKYDIVDDTLIAELTIGFRDVNNYRILVGVYDSRGKMIGFDTVSVNNANVIQNINISISKVSSATTSTISVINPVNLQFIRLPQLRIFALD